MKRIKDFVVLMGPVCFLAACTGSIEAEDPDTVGLYADDQGSVVDPAGGDASADTWGREGLGALDDGGAAPSPEGDDPGTEAEGDDPATAPEGDDPAPEPAADEPVAEDPADPAPSGGAGAGAASGVASLGALPSALSGLRWPTAPTTTRTVTATTAAEVQAAAAVPGTRIDVRGAVGGGVLISANDIDIVADGATDLGRVTIARSVRRVRITGGRWAGFLVEIPADFSGGSATYRADWLIEDLWIRDTTVDSPDKAFEIRGRRIAIENNDATAILYSVWCGDTGPTIQNEDIILVGNDFESAGPESTVRLVSVLRSATVDNTFFNPNKHNYRIHGTSDLNYAGRNLLINSGVMLGRMPGDDLGRVWFDDNVMHHNQPDLFNPDAAIDALTATDNVVHSDVRSTFFEGTPGAGWVMTGNVLGPYTPPPPT